MTFEEWFEEKKDQIPEGSKAEEYWEKIWPEMKRAWNTASEYSIQEAYNLQDENIDEPIDTMELEERIRNNVMS